MCSWAATPSRGLDSAISCAKREKHSLGWVTEGVFLAGWWYTYPSEKYELGLLFPTEWKIKIHVPNHQPARSFVEKTMELLWQSSKPPPPRPVGPLRSLVPAAIPLKQSECGK